MKKIAFLTLIFAVMSFLLFGCKTNYAPLDVVDNVDFTKYQGKWYEIARLPNSFEAGLECCMANYRLLENEKIEVINTGRRINDRSVLKTAKGKAYVPDAMTPAKIKVSFFGPFYGNYWILALDTEYRYVLVGEPSRKYLWVLARNTTMPEADYQNYLKIASDAGFDTSKIIRVKQDCTD